LRRRQGSSQQLYHQEARLPHQGDAPEFAKVLEQLEAASLLEAALAEEAHDV
jgi:hypothetical protein